MIPNKLISRQEILGGVHGRPAQQHPDLLPFPVPEATDDCYAPLVAACLEGVGSPSLTLTPLHLSFLSGFLDYGSVMPYYG